jgi:HAD superfamily hydrolase (TIGR01490 family)
MQTTCALFDFDGTLIRGDSILLFMRYAWRKRLCTTFDVVRFAVAGGLYSVRLLSPKRAKALALHFLKGMAHDTYAAAAEDFCKNVLVPRLYPQGIETIKRHREAGDTVLLVSASPTFYLAPLKQILGFTDVLGTEFETDEAGRFTGEIVGLNNRGAEKPIRLKNYLAASGAELDFQTSSAYGDSAHDLPMLSMCANIYAVNPNGKLKKKLHTLDGVTVLNWKEKP